MARDFLGIGGKDSAKGEAGFLGSSAVHWPFSNNIPAMQQFMNVKAAQEERSRKIMFDHLSSPVFQALPTVGVFDSVHRSPSVFVPQKHLAVDRQGIHQFQQPGYPVLGADPLSTAARHSTEVRLSPAVSHHSIPIATSCPFFKIGGSTNGSNPGVASSKQQQPFVGGSTIVPPPGGGLMTAAFAPRNTTKPSGTASQLTIFYAGTISVFDDVPLERAQAIMFLAANGLNMNSNVARVSAQIPPVATPTKVAKNEAINMNQIQNMHLVQTQRNAVQTCAMMSSQKSVASQSGAHIGSGHSSTDDLTGVKNVGSLVPTTQHEPPKAIVTAVGSAAGASLMPRAIPQARKASLARFLEKRKERVSSAAPYPPPQKSPDCNSGFDGKSVTVETAYSSSKEPSWRLSAHKDSSACSSSPSTKLEM